MHSAHSEQNHMSVLHICWVVLSCVGKLQFLKLVVGEKVFQTHNSHKNDEIK